MNFKGYRIGIILFVFCISLGLVLGITRFTHQHRVIEPIYETFQSIDGVKDVSLEEQGQHLRVVLTLEQVHRLEKTISQIIQTAEEFGLTEQIIIVDQANELLEETFYKIHLAIEEAIAIGNFQEMAETIQEILAATNINHRVYVNQDYIFVQLHYQESYLYQVFSRHEGISVIRQPG